MTKPVVTVEEMRAIDRAAPEAEEVLIQRAGLAVCRIARRMLGGLYGRRIVVIAGKGNNGADGRVAATLLTKGGARARVVTPDEARIPESDLVIDAAYGTGFRGDHEPGYGWAVPVLAVDIPSGIDGNSGRASSAEVHADVTVTFAALKPGLLLEPGRHRAGRIEVADIGLDVSGARQHAVDTSDVLARLPERPETGAHKWQTALGVVAGSAGMTGAAELCARGAGRSGCGMVRLMVPGSHEWQLPASEAVSRPLPENGWAREALAEAGRLKAIVVGPGLGRSPDTIAAVQELVATADLPLLIDGDALFAIAQADTAGLLKRRTSPTVLTPHDGELSYLTGAKALAERWKSAEDLARRTGATVLLKGSTTVVANEQGVLYSTAGTTRLATAGTGDVLSGVVGAFLAQGMAPEWAAAAGAHVHGSASQRGLTRGQLAGDIPDLVAGWLSDIGVRP